MSNSSNRRRALLAALAVSSPLCATFLFWLVLSASVVVGDGPWDALEGALFHTSMSAMGPFVDPRLAMFGPAVFTMLGWGAIALGCAFTRVMLVPRWVLLLVSSAWMGIGTVRWIATSMAIT